MLGTARPPPRWRYPPSLGRPRYTLSALAAGAGERGEARNVSLTSGAHMRSPIVFDDIQFERRDYDPQVAYAQSKTATSLLAVEATRRWAPLTTPVVGC
jgi:NAD(P)-dependent dehydrogenase (short-subunit alcohol dehydrogenase family)